MRMPMAKGSKRQSLYHGILIVDKPAGMTSQDVVNVVRRAAGTRRVGHTGTLDPLATGLLIVMLGEATKLSEYLMGYDKAYEGTMRIGVRSDTYDVEGTLEETGYQGDLTLERLQELAAGCTGDVMQTPPAYSAVKVQGKKLYEYARAGAPVEVEPRPVTVHSYEVLDLVGTEATFRVKCSAGTYVRSLVHDVGELAGCGAVVKELRRTENGDFRMEEAIDLERVRATPLEAFGDLVTPMLDAIPAWSVYFVAEKGAMWVARGQAIPVALAELDSESKPPRLGDFVFISRISGDAIAVSQVVPVPPGNPPADLKRHTGLWLQPVKLLSSPSESGIT